MSGDGDDTALAAPDGCVLAGWTVHGACDLSTQDEGHSSYTVTAASRGESSTGARCPVDAKEFAVNATYLVSAMVRVSPPPPGRQIVVVTINAGGGSTVGEAVAEAGERWGEIRAYFRLESPSPEVVVSVHGPSPEFDLSLMNPRLAAVDRKSRFPELKKKTDEVRKRDVVLKFAAPAAAGATVKVRQTANSFPFGTCISRSNIDSEIFTDFFVKNFNYAVFENELKWYSTEPEVAGEESYADADELLAFCRRHRKRVRGHCIFWADEKYVQPWVKALEGGELRAAVDRRLESLLTRYRGQFEHHDVNNEMLHCSFFADRLGADIRPFMFKRASELDPAADLFVNDYNVLTGNDPAATPEKYIDHVNDLRRGGAPVGGVGVQGHLTHPVGEVLCTVLDKLAALELPVWVTELDVVSLEESVRADDLEVALREAFAHPAVEGVVLWGFWAANMWRRDAALVDADGRVNATGKRFAALMEEWSSSRAEGCVDENGEFRFRGFCGSYDVEVSVGGAPAVKKAKIVVDERAAGEQVVAVEV